MCTRNRAWEEFASAYKEVVRVPVPICMATHMCLCGALRGTQLATSAATGEIHTEADHGIAKSFYFTFWWHWRWPKPDWDLILVFTEDRYRYTPFKFRNKHLMTPCSTASELYEQGGSCTERERRREGETSQAEKKKRHYLVFMSVGWHIFLKKSAAQRYWSNISVSLVSTAIN